MLEYIGLLKCIHHPAGSDELQFIILPLCSDCVSKYRGKSYGLSACVWTRKKLSRVVGGSWKGTGEERQGMQEMRKNFYTQQVTLFLGMHLFRKVQTFPFGSSHLPTSRSSFKSLMFQEGQSISLPWQTTSWVSKNHLKLINDAMRWEASSAEKQILIQHPLREKQETNEMRTLLVKIN